MSEATVNYCANHPTLETNLRCNNCGKFICAKCAVRTPTGYRCRECVRGHQKAFDTAQPMDYVIAFVLAGVLSAIGSVISTSLGFFIIFLAPFAGGLIGDVVRAATGKRRSPSLYRVAAIGVAVGGLVLIARPLAFLVTTGNFGGLFGLLWPIVYVVLAVPAAYYRLSGIEMGRR
jgi:hypothetical protein